MPETISTVVRDWLPRDRDATMESRPARLALILATLAVLVLFLFLPLLVVFVEAFR